MGKNRYTEDYKEIIVDLYKSEMSLAELSSEYDIARSTINGWIRGSKEIKVSEDEVVTPKDIMALKKKMAILIILVIIQIGIVLKIIISRINKNTVMIKNLDAI